MSRPIMRTADTFDSLTLFLSKPATTVDELWQIQIPLAGLVYDHSTSSKLLASAVLDLRIGNTSSLADGIRFSLLANHVVTNTTTRTGILSDISLLAQIPADTPALVLVPLVVTFVPFYTDSPSFSDIALPTLDHNNITWSISDINNGTVNFYAISLAVYSASSETGVPATRTISTTAPLTGGGDLSADRVLAITDATTSAVGAVQLAADGGTDAGTVVQGSDSRLNNSRTPTAHASTHAAGGSDTLATMTGASSSTAGSAGFVPAPAAGDQAKVLTGAGTWVDQASGSGSGVPTTRMINTTSPLTGGGDLSADRTLAVDVATAFAAGVVQLAVSGSTSAGRAVQGSDSRLSDARTPTAHASTHQYGGSDVVGTATSTANAIPMAGSDGTLADAWLSANIGRLATAQSWTADQTFSARTVLTNGKRNQVPSASFGCPTSGTYLTGDAWLDAANAQWLCTAGGTPGTWVQITPGVATTWSGGGSTDITTTTNWLGGALLDGYRTYYPTTGDSWTYSTTYSRWVGDRFMHKISANLTAYSASNTIGISILDTTYDYLIESHVVNASIATTADAGNYWTISLYRATSSLSAGVISASVLTKTTTTIENLSASVGYILATSTYPVLEELITKTGSPGNITPYGGMIYMRRLKK